MTPNHLSGVSGVEVLASVVGGAVVLKKLLADEFLKSVSSFDSLWSYCSFVKAHGDSFGYDGKINFVDVAERLVSMMAQVNSVDYSYVARLKGAFVRLMSYAPEESGFDVNDLQVMLDGFHQRGVSNGEVVSCSFGCDRVGRRGSCFVCDVKSGVKRVVPVSVVVPVYVSPVVAAILSDKGVGSVTWGIDGMARCWLSFVMLSVEPVSSVYKPGAYTQSWHRLSKALAVKAVSSEGDTFAFDFADVKAETGLVSLLHKEGGRVAPCVFRRQLLVASGMDCGEAQGFGCDSYARVLEFDSVWKRHFKSGGVKYVRYMTSVMLYGSDHNRGFYRCQEDAVDKFCIGYDRFIEAVNVRHGSVLVASCSAVGVIGEGKLVAFDTELDSGYVDDDSDDDIDPWSDDEEVEEVEDVDVNGEGAVVELKPEVEEFGDRVISMTEGGLLAQGSFGEVLCSWTRGTVIDVMMNDLDSVLNACGIPSFRREGGKDEDQVAEFFHGQLGLVVSKVHEMLRKGLDVDVAYDWSVGAGLSFWLLLRLRGYAPLVDGVRAAPRPLFEADFKVRRSVVENGLGVVFDKPMKDEFAYSVMLFDRSVVYRSSVREIDVKDFADEIFKTSGIVGDKLVFDSFCDALHYGNDSLAAAVLAWWYYHYGVDRAVRVFCWRQRKSCSDVGGITEVELYRERNRVEVEETDGVFEIMSGDLRFRSKDKDKVLRAYCGYIKVSDSGFGVEEFMNLLDDEVNVG